MHSIIAQVSSVAFIEMKMFAALIDSDVTAPGGIQRCRKRKEKCSIKKLNPGKYIGALNLKFKNVSDFKKFPSELQNTAAFTG